jgi:hypothetical protein
LNDPAYYKDDGIKGIMNIFDSALRDSAYTLEASDIEDMINALVAEKTLNKPFADMLLRAYGFEE